MQDTGIQTPVGIKVKGPDLAVVEEIARDLETRLRGFPGTQAVIAERISQGYFVDAQVDEGAIGNRGENVGVRGRLGAEIETVAAGDVGGGVRERAAVPLKPGGGAAVGIGRVGERRARREQRPERERPRQQGCAGASPKRCGGA